MRAYELAQLISQKEASNNLYLEFLKVSDLSMGLPKDPPRGRRGSPVTTHGGRGLLRGERQDGYSSRAMQAGSIVYVAKNVEHRFHSIEEERCPDDHGECRKVDGDCVLRASGIFK